nr:thioredoxin H9-like [Ipomoea batatas]
MTQIQQSLSESNTVAFRSNSTRFGKGSGFIKGKLNCARENSVSVIENGAYLSQVMLCTQVQKLQQQSKNDGDDSDHHVEFAGGNVHLITTKESWEQKLEEARRDGKTVVANFSASWCGPCRMIAPLYCELSEKHPSLMFLTVDVDELTEFSTSWDIKATPTFFFLKDGQQVDKLVGANKPELQKKITAIVDTETQCQK